MKDENKYKATNNKKHRSNVDQQQSIDAKMDVLKKEIVVLDNKLSALKKEKAHINPIEADKKVFLTFDDGPSPLTEEILDILDSKNVKATFFTIGTQMELYPNIVAKTYEKGHMVLPHSYSHDYSIYTTFETFNKDLDKVEETYHTVLGQKPPSIFRFPGGSSNQSSYKFGGKNFMENLTFNIREKGYYYVDWNVICGDASSISKNPEEMLNQVINGSTNKNVVVALFHDVKRNKETARILPDVIDFYKANNYTFRTFRDITDGELSQMENMGIVNKQINH